MNFRPLLLSASLVVAEPGFFSLDVEDRTIIGSWDDSTEGRTGGFVVLEEGGICQVYEASDDDGIEEPYPVSLSANCDLEHVTIIAATILEGVKPFICCLVTNESTH
eukprot:Trichotokara_eunicae@DN9133_c0_g1_i1.p1